MVSKIQSRRGVITVSRKTLSVVTIMFLGVILGSAGGLVSE
jgi:hypothetical protein